MDLRVRRRLAVLPIIVAAAAALAGCANLSSVPAPVASGPFFYPPPPALPRIQLLATFSSERDLKVERGGFASFIAGKDKDERQLVQPYGVALDGGKLYVADSKVGGLVVFDLSHKRISLLTGTAGNRMQRPINVTIDRDGTKYVTDTGRDQILVFDRDDRFVTAFGAQGQFRPVDAAIVGERLYVVDIQHHQVQVLDKRLGKLLFKFGQPGSQPGELFQPTNISVGPDGDVYVSETGNFRVQRFTADGKPVRTYGEAGARAGAFARPKGIAVDRAGRLYVGDAAFQNVQIFNREGRVLMDFGAPTEAGQGLNLPAAVRIDYDNVDLFRRYADSKFAVEYLILVVSQFGPNKVDVFGFGRMSGVDYPADDAPAPAAAR